MRERAREADDKKLAAVKRIREKNHKRAQRLKGGKERQLKIVKEERIGKRKESRGECSPSKKSRSIRRGQIY